MIALEHIPIEHVGRARDFRRRVLAEDTALLDISHRLVARIKRHPLRSVRREITDRLIHDWRETLPVIFSLDFAVSRTRHGSVITERRIRRRDDAGQR